MQSNPLFQWWQHRAEERAKEESQKEAAAREKAAKNGVEYLISVPVTNGYMERLPLEIRQQIYTHLWPKDCLRLAGTSWVMAIELHVLQAWHGIITKKSKANQRMALYTKLNYIQQALLADKMLNPRLCCKCVQLFPANLAMHDGGYYQTDEVIQKRNWTARICLTCDPVRYNEEIYQTEALRVFKLSASLLQAAKIPFELQPNPGGYTYKKKKVYKTLDVYDVALRSALEKAEVKEVKKAQQLKRKRDQAVEKERKKILKLEQNARQKELKDALKPFGLRITKDCTLCNQYISANGEGHNPDFESEITLKEVIDSVLEKHRLAEGTV